MLWSGCATGLTGDSFNVSGTQARTSGAVVSSTGGDVEYWLQYGTTTSYGSETTHQTTQGTQAKQPRTVSALLTGLQRSTTYHYRLCAQDSQQSGGPGCGEDRTVTTPNLACGDTITHDFILSGNVYCESFAVPGLIVEADGIDINLNGAVMRGPLMQFFDSSRPIAIDNSAGHDDVTVRGGTIDAWGQLAALGGASFNTIRNIGGSNTSGVSMEGGESNVIRSVSMPGGTFGTGLLARNVENLVVADSTGTKWTITGNQARVVRNHVTGGPRFSDCLDISGSRNRIADNTIGGCPGGGLVIRAGSGNEVVGNEASGSPSDPTTGPDPDGIIVGAFTAGTLLENNFVHDNDDDGIDVRGTATRLKGNRADDNGDFGIDAVAGVTDAGGNTASGNGNPLQCRNVFCATAP
jgi:parallel beta-helix repeat protein